MNTSEAIRFICIRKYVLEIEKIIFKLYDILEKRNVTIPMLSITDRSPMIYLGDPKTNTQQVTTSYWSNVYGCDATEDDLIEIEKELLDEEKQILLFCMKFVDVLKQRPLQIKKIEEYIHPIALKGWGDFKKVQEFINSIPNPGITSKVRYNQSRDTAYVRILPNCR